MRKGLVLSIALLGFLFSGNRDLSARPAGFAVDWTKYHNHADVTNMLKSWSGEYKNICKMSSIGKSFQGKDLWCMEITNYAAGTPEGKSGIYLDGNTHDEELGGAETCLYIINHLLTNYGKDPAITKLVDTKVFYIVPKINPDGSDVHLRKPGDPVEPNLKKVDDDGDGLLDEDDREDLNGDGLITLMRIRDENGPMKTSPKDSRLMVQRKIDEKGEWRIIGPEGLDNDKDGRINEDPPGSAVTVTNRNYPAYWAAEWIQSGGGIYPLSQPEAKAQVDFLLAHPNIASTQSFHTHSGVILYGYCGLTDDYLPAEDLKNFKIIGALGTEISGYALLSVFGAFTTDKFNPRHGDFTDWIYDTIGAFPFCTELWKAPGETGRSTFDGTDENIAMQWNDKELGGKGFINWTKFQHPQFGEVEIGGWNRVFFTRNPPPKFAEAEWRKTCLFEVKRAELVPNLRIADVKMTSLGDKLYKIVAIVENDGYLPTYVTQKAIDTKAAKPVVVKVGLDKAELLFGEEKTDIGHIKGNSPDSPARYGPGDALIPVNQKTVQWLVRAKGSGASVIVTASSPKAGTASRKIPLG